MNKVKWKIDQDDRLQITAKAFDRGAQIAEIKGRYDSGFWTESGFICHCSAPFPRSIHGLAAAKAYVESWHAEALELLK